MVKAVFALLFFNPLNIVLGEILNFFTLAPIT
jgi:hypothetical protein